MSDPERSSLVGTSVVIERAFSQDDLVQFGRLSCDDHPIHVDPDFSRASGLAGTIVQGSLMLGLMAGASTALFRQVDRPVLSYGYDRLRFTKPAVPGAVGLWPESAPPNAPIAVRTPAEITTFLAMPFLPCRWPHASTPERAKA